MAAPGAHQDTDTVVNSELLLVASAAAAAASAGREVTQKQKTEEEEEEKEKVKKLQQQVEQEQQKLQLKRHQRQQVEQDQQKQQLDEDQQDLLIEEGKDEDKKGHPHGFCSLLLFCTNNQHKLHEVQKILGTRDALLLCADIHLIELQSATPEAVARAKCLEALYKLKLHWTSPVQKQPKNNTAATPQRVSTPPPAPLVLTEDTCLCFEALNGMPGPYVKWFLERAGPEGLCKMLHGFDKPADIKVFQGRTKGTIVREPRGPRTFGWDCIFQPDGHDKTFAEMEKETKNSISHRYKAMDQLRAYLQQRNEAHGGD